jgi:hypothetical protein
VADKTLEKKASEKPVVKDILADSGSRRPWHAVQIISLTVTCDAVRALAGKRYLSGEAPTLPLAECTRSGDCECYFKKHADRRGGPRRIEEVTPIRLKPHSGPDLRAKSGRRRTDYEN